MKSENNDSTIPGDSNKSDGDNSDLLEHDTDYKSANLQEKLTTLLPTLHDATGMHSRIFEDLVESIQGCLASRPGNTLASVQSTTAYYYRRYLAMLVLNSFIKGKGSMDVGKEGNSQDQPFLPKLSMFTLTQQVKKMPQYLRSEEVSKDIDMALDLATAYAGNKKYLNAWNTSARHTTISIMKSPPRLPIWHPTPINSSLTSCGNNMVCANIATTFRAACCDEIL